MAWHHRRMSADIFFFFSGKQEHITVVGMESALHLAQILSRTDRAACLNSWKIRRNKSSDVFAVANFPDFSHIFAPQDIDANLEAAIMKETQSVELKPELPAPELLKEHFGNLEASPKARDPNIEQRKHSRHDMKFRVLVISGQKSFRTFSKNVSEGGMALEHSVPKELIGKECRVIIGSADLRENIEFKAQLVGDPHNPRAVAFIEPQLRFSLKLADWIKVHAQAA